MNSKLSREHSSNYLSVPNALLLPHLELHAVEYVVAARKRTEMRKETVNLVNPAVANNQF